MTSQKKRRQGKGRKNLGDRCTRACYPESKKNANEGGKAHGKEMGERKKISK